MHSKNINILLTRKLPDLIEKKLSNKYNVVSNKHDKPLNYKDLKKKVEDVDILVPCISDTIDSSIIKSAKRLKLIANFGNGVDNIDLITAKEKKILVFLQSTSALYIVFIYRLYLVRPCCGCIC